MLKYVYICALFCDKIDLVINELPIGLLLIDR